MQGTGGSACQFVVTDCWWLNFLISQGNRSEVDAVGLAGDWLFRLVDSSWHVADHCEVWSVLLETVKVQTNAVRNPAHIAVFLDFQSTSGYNEILRTYILKYVPCNWLGYLFLESIFSVMYFIPRRNHMTREIISGWKQFDEILQRMCTVDEVLNVPLSEEHNTCQWMSISVTGLSTYITQLVLFLNRQMLNCSFALHDGWVIYKMGKHRFLLKKRKGKLWIQWNCWVISTLHKWGWV